MRVWCDVCAMCVSGVGCESCIFVWIQFFILARNRAYLPGFHSSRAMSCTSRYPL